MLTALIDGDILLHVACAAVADDFGFDFDELPEGQERPANLKAAQKKMTSAVDAIMDKLGSDKLNMAFSVPYREGWRRKILPSYKSNRDEVVKPPGFYEVRAWAVDKYNALIVDTMEADDILGIWMTGVGIRGEKVIVSEDKDLLTVPGQVWRPRKNVGETSDEGVLVTTPKEADRAHMIQTLMGDSSDGYKGIPGVGVVKATKILDSLRAFESIPSNKYDWDRVFEAYEAAGLTEADALVQARVARILRAGEWNSETGVRLWSPRVAHTA